MKMVKELTRYFGLMRVRTKSYTVSLLAWAFLENLMPPLLAFMIKGILDAAAGSDSARFFSALRLAPVMVVAMIVSPRMSHINFICMRDIMHDLRLRMFTHLQAVPMSFFDTQHSGQNIHRLNATVEDFKRSLTRGNRGFITIFLAGFSSIVTILIMDWRLGLGMVVVGYIFVRITEYLARPQRKNGQLIQSTNTELSGKLADLLGGFREIKMFRAGRGLIKQYQQQNAELCDHLITSAKLGARVQCSSEFFGFVINVGFVFVGVLMAIMGQVTLGTVVGIIGLQNRLSWVFNDFGRYWSDLVAGFAVSDQIYHILDIEIEPERYSMPTGTSDAMIEFRDVGFAYQDKQTIVQGLSFIIKHGESLALTGESGCGKSTAAKLLLGFYPPTSGQIFVDGKSIDAYSLAELREKIAYVPQNAFLFDASILENLRLGRPDASKEEVIAAARAANADEFICRFPEGYATLVGERGNQLSGGQRQRIAIARAILKQAPILILDEATSALDYESEQLVNEALAHLANRSTCLIIAHRESTIVYADRIHALN